MRKPALSILASVLSVILVIQGIPFFSAACILTKALEEVVYSEFHWSQTSSD